MKVYKQEVYYSLIGLNIDKAVRLGVKKVNIEKIKKENNQYYFLTYTFNKKLIDDHKKFLFE